MRRRFTSTDGLLLLTVLIWSLNITVTKYILTHGLQPLAYGAVRFGIACAIFAVITYVLERSFRIGGRRQLVTVAVAAAMLLLNQVCLVYSLKLANATTVARLDPVAIPRMSKLYFPRSFEISRTAFAAGVASLTSGLKKKITSLLPSIDETSSDSPSRVRPEKFGRGRSRRAGAGVFLAEAARPPSVECSRAAAAASSAAAAASPGAASPHAMSMLSSAMLRIRAHTDRQHTSHIPDRQPTGSVPRVVAGASRRAATQRLANLWAKMPVCGPIRGAATSIGAR